MTLLIFVRSHRVLNEFVIPPVPACRGTRATCPGVPSKRSGEPALSEVEGDLRFLSVHPIWRLLIRVTTLHLSSRAQPDFLLRGSTSGNVCDSPLESRMKSTEATVVDRKSGAAERLSVLSSVRGMVWLWKRRGRGPLGKRGCVSHFPPTLRRLVFLRKQNSSRWRLSELLQHVPSFGIEPHQEFMSQGDANHLLGFAGRR